jgi:hypothetical protein
MQSYSNSLDLKNLNLSLFLDVVGGQHLMLNIGEGKILKLTSEKEVNFYKEYLDSKFSFLPKCFSFFDRQDNPELNTIIIDYKQQLDFFFYEIVRDYDENKIRSFMFYSDLSIANEYLDIFYKFKKHCEENIHLKKDCESIKLLEENFLNFPEEKQKFILFYYIVRLWKKLNKSKFIILEDLTYGMQRPCIIDFKLGYINANLHQNYREWVSNSIKDLGLRLMGTQVI